VQLRPRFELLSSLWAGWQPTAGLPPRAPHRRGTGGRLDRNTWWPTGSTCQYDQSITSRHV